MTEAYEKHCHDKGWDVMYNAYSDTDAGVCATLAKTTPRGLRFEYTSAYEGDSPLGAPVWSLNDNMHRWIKSDTGLSRSELEQEEAVMYEDLDALKRDILRGHYFGWRAF